jgi:hypothetical protein
MADISNMTINNDNYNFKDAQARSDLDGLFKFKTIGKELTIAGRFLCSRNYGNC